MKLKPNKSNILNFFMYYGWAMIIFLVVSFASLTLILSSINKINDYQRFSIFFSAYGLKEERFKDELLDYLKDDGVLEVSYYDYLNNDTQIVSYYETYGVKSDINILSEKDMVALEEKTGDYYIELSNSLLNELEISNKYNLYSYEEKSYAIKIYDKDSDDYNNQFIYQEWISFESSTGLTDNFYLLLRRNSLNFGEYGKINKTSNAIKGLRYLLHENEK